MRRISSSWIIDPITGDVRADPNQPARRRVGIVPQHRQRGTGNASARKFLGVYARPEDAAVIDAEAARRGMSRSAFMVYAALGLAEETGEAATCGYEPCDGGACLYPKDHEERERRYHARELSSANADPAPPDPDPALASLVKG